MTTRWVEPGARHGTPAGWRRHQRLDEQPCDECVRARRDYDEKRRSESPHLAEARARARAQGLAMTWLRRNHVDEYRELYAQAKAEIIAADEARSGND